MKHTIAVTGATGHIGHELVTRLLSRGHAVRALGRDAKKLAALGNKGAEVRAGSLDDRAFLADAFKGATAVFAMLPPSHTATDYHATQKKNAESLAGALKDAGVKRVVTLSSVGAELPSGTGPIGSLHLLEKLVDGLAGLDVVHLRATYFQENLLSSVGLIKAMGIAGSPMKPDVSIPMIATRDIAAAAAELLDQGTFKGRSVRYLLGPRDYTQTEATKILGAAIGRPDLKYVPFPEADAKKGMVGAGLSPQVADLMLEMIRGFNEGRIKAEPRSPANTTPTTLEEFARTVFAPAFQSGGTGH